LDARLVEHAKRLAATAVGEVEDDGLYRVEARELAVPAIT
jgi:hypothetical protein